MRLALPHWQDRISPVLDVARALLVVELDHDTEVSRQGVPLEDESPIRRARRIEELGVHILICGAISKPLELALTAAGIEVIAQTCGVIDQVIKAFLADELEQEKYLMPGCCGSRRRSRKQARSGDKSP